MKKIMAIFFVATIIGGCMTANQALNVTAKPTDLDGYWSANGGGHTLNWFIRPDGTGVHCEVNNMTLSSSPLVLDLAVVDNKIYLNNTYEITRAGKDNFKASTWGGAFSLDFKRMEHPPAACKQYF